MTKKTNMVKHNILSAVVLQPTFARTASRTPARQAECSDNTENNGENNGYCQFDLRVLLRRKSENCPNTQVHIQMH